MTRMPEAGWDELRDLWRAESPQSEELTQRMRAAVRRHSRQMRAAMAADIVGFAGLAALAAIAWIRRPDAFTAAWAVIVVTLAAGIFAFNIWNRAGAWRAASSSTVACIELSIRRAKAKLRVARAVAWLVLLEVAVDAVLLGWAHAAGRVSPARIAATAVVIGLLVVATLVWCRWYGSHARRELRELDALRASTTEAPA